MHVTTTHYEDFKRFVTGVGVAPPPAFDPATGEPMAGSAAPPVPEAPKLDPNAPKKPASAPEPKAKAKAGPKMDGAVYHWGGTPANGAWGCALVSGDFKNVVQSGSLDGKEPKTFAADFPDAVQLDGALSIA